MNKISVSTICFLVNFSGLYSSVWENDSLYSGRVCYIILNNGFESDGIITNVKEDTIWFRNEYTEYKIPVNQIKFVNKPDDFDEPEENSYYEPDTSDYCNIYLGPGSKMTDVRLLLINDSDLYVLKWKTKKPLRVGELRKIEFSGSNFGEGFLAGAGFGLGLSLIYVLSASNGYGINHALPYCFTFSVFTGLLGGVINLLGSESQSYYFNQGYSADKVKKLKYITRKHRF